MFTHFCKHKRKQQWRIFEIRKEIMKLHLSSSETVPVASLLQKSSVFPLILMKLFRNSSREIYETLNIQEYSEIWWGWYLWSEVEPPLPWGLNFISKLPRSAEAASFPTSRKFRNSASGCRLPSSRIMCYHLYAQSWRSSFSQSRRAATGPPQLLADWGASAVRWSVLGDCCYATGVMRSV